MATYKYNHAVKANGKVYPANAPIEIEDPSNQAEIPSEEMPETTTAAEQTAKNSSKPKRTRKTKASTTETK